MSATSPAARRLGWLMLALPLAAALLAPLLFPGDPNRLSWGILIQTGQSHALRGWWLALFPGLALALASVGLTLLSLDQDKLRNAER